MAESTTTPLEAILAVDIGATSIKCCPVDQRGQLLSDVVRVATPYPCLPDTLVTAVAGLINASALARAGVGFPGDIVDGVVVEPGNLSRAGGIATPVDPVIHAQWVGCHLETELRARCRAQVRVVNDATLAAYGYAEGVGRELIFTLGTGFGIALVVDGTWQKIPDVGNAPYYDLGTYDEVMGEPARARDTSRWHAHLAEAIGAFVREYSADVVHVGGGNARNVSAQDLRDAGCLVVFNDNEGTLRGAARLFDGA
ncbi:MAG TPA: ROK family protein [Acidimicrobiales bacterium]